MSAVETRVVAGVTLDLPDLDEPATGRLVSVPAHRRPLVNDLFLRRGRWIERGRPDEVLASEGFVIANKLELGDRVPAVLNGRLRHLTIVGVALSPEFIYSIRPGEMVPDDRRYGVLWMDEQALAAAFDMEGGFNDVVLALAPGASDRGSRLAPRSHPRAVRRTRCRSARPADLALDGDERDARSSRPSASCCRWSSWPSPPSS